MTTIIRLPPEDEEKVRRSLRRVGGSYRDRWEQRFALEPHTAVFGNLSRYKSARLSGKGYQLPDARRFEP